MKGILLQTSIRFCVELQAWVSISRYVHSGKKDSAKRMRNLFDRRGNWGLIWMMAEICKVSNVNLDFGREKIVKTIWRESKDD